jgi:histidine triad (HIT) family protein
MARTSASVGDRMSAQTVFDRILEGEVPAEVVYEDDHVLAFRDVQPQAPVHVLVIPKRRASTFDEMSERDPAEVGRFFQGVAATARALDLLGDGYRVVVNNGRDANQTVAYLHAHVLGGRRLGWPPG